MPGPKNSPSAPAGGFWSTTLASTCREQVKEGERVETDLTIGSKKFGHGLLTIRDRVLSKPNNPQRTAEVPRGLLPPGTQLHEN
jgi:hypothetical protein